MNTLSKLTHTHKSEYLQAYFLLKPPGDATPFLASSLELRRRARGYCRVQGGGGCDALEGQSEKSFGRRVWTVKSQVQRYAVGLGLALQAHSIRRGRVSRGSR